MCQRAQRSSLFGKVSVLGILIPFVCSCLCPFPVTSAHAQTLLSPTATVLGLPAPGAMVPLSDAYNPAIIAGMTLHPDDPFLFDFIVHPGDDVLQGDALKKESTKLIKYFMAALTTPEEDMWVNLSPYEKDRIIPEGFGDTEMGRDLLAQDYLLKQLTASAMDPEGELGSEFWDRVYKKAYERYGTTKIPMNTFKKVWVVPDKASVYVNGTNVFVAESRHKVMMEEDYLAMSQGHNVTRSQEAVHEPSAMSHEPSEAIIRELIIPEIEKEVNEGKTFANLRQISNAVILATWYKRHVVGSMLEQVYTDQHKTEGIDTQDKEINQKIYQQYVRAFKKGVMNFIKEEYDPVTKQAIPRKYFSGGMVQKRADIPTVKDYMMLGTKKLEGSSKVRVRLDPEEVGGKRNAVIDDRAMLTEMTVSVGMSEIGQLITSQPSNDFERARRNVFGDNVDGWLKELKIKGSYDSAERRNAVADLMERNDFKELILSAYQADLAVAILRYLIEKEIHPGTRSMRTFLKELKNKTREWSQKEVNVIDLSIADVIDFITVLSLPDTQKKMDSLEFRLLPKSDKMFDLFEIISESMKFDEDKGLDRYHSALTQRISRYVGKKDVEIVNVSASRVREIRKILRKNEMTDLFASDAFALLDRVEKFEALHKKVTEEMSIKISRVDLFATLPYYLSENITRKHLIVTTVKAYFRPGRMNRVFLGQGSRSLEEIKKAVFGGKVKSWQEVNAKTRFFNQQKAANIDEMLTLYKNDLIKECEGLSKEEVRVALVRFVIDKDIVLGSHSLYGFFKRIKERGPPEIAERILKTNVAVNDFINIMAYSATEEFQNFVDSPQFHRSLVTDRIYRIAKKITNNKNVSLSRSLNLEVLHNILMPQVSRTLSKREIPQVNGFDLDNLKRIRDAIEKKDTQEFLTTDWLTFNKEDRLVELAWFLTQKGVFKEDGSLRFLFTALQENLLAADYRQNVLGLENPSFGIFKYEMQSVLGKISQLKQVRKITFHSKIAAFLNDPGFFDLEFEDRLLALFNEFERVADEEGMPFNLQSLEIFYYFLPFGLSDNVSKKDVPFVPGTVESFNRVRKGLRHKEIKKILADNGFRQQSKERRLIVFTDLMKKLGFVDPMVRTKNVFSSLSHPVKQILLGDHKGGIDRVSPVSEDKPMLADPWVRPDEHDPKNFISVVKAAAINRLFKPQVNGDIYAYSASLITNDYLETFGSDIVAELKISRDHVLDVLWRVSWDIEAANKSKKSLRDYMEEHEAFLKDNIIFSRTLNDKEGAIQKSPSEILEQMQSMSQELPKTLPYETVKVLMSSHEVIVRNDKDLKVANIKIIVRNDFRGLVWFKRRLKRFFNEGSDTVQDEYDDFAPVLAAIKNGLPLVVVGEAGADIEAAKKIVREEFLARKIELAETSTNTFTVDSAEMKNGGIDLNPQNIDIQTSGDDIKIYFPQYQQNLPQPNINGLVPVIINVSPVTNIPALLGIRKDPEDIDFASEQFVMN